MLTALDNQVHHFGGTWTEVKLNILQRYLHAYSNALKNKKFEKVYIDAFAGTGYIETQDDALLEGSARICLQTDPQYDRYYFIEKNRKRANQLKSTINSDFPFLSLKAQVIQGDCNDELKKLCQSIDWKYKRGIVFLDPYALHVSFDTLKAIAATQVIDVWYLFPMSAANRLMKNDGQIDKSLRKILDSIFGEKEWFNKFYHESPQTSLFGYFEQQHDVLYKVVNTEEMKKYILSRLGNIFPYVSEHSKILYNSKNSPLFLLCFAISNPSSKAIGLAKRISSDILK